MLNLRARSPVAGAITPTRARCWLEHSPWRSGWHEVKLYMHAFVSIMRVARRRRTGCTWTVKTPAACICVHSTPLSRVAAAGHEHGEATSVLLSERGLEKFRILEDKLEVSEWVSCSEFQFRVKGRLSQDFEVETISDCCINSAWPSFATGH